MKTSRILCWASFGALMVTLSLSLAQASTESAESRSTSSESEGNSRLARLLKEANLSSGVSEVARMAELGTDTAVLTSYVQNSDKPYKLRPEDITHLRDHAVPDSVVTAMIERGAELRAKAPPLPPPVPQPNPASVITVVASAKRSAPVSTVTVIGRSDLRRGLSSSYRYYGGHGYGSRGYYGRVYSPYGSYSYYGPSYRHGSSHVRNYGARYCR